MSIDSTIEARGAVRTPRSWVPAAEASVVQLAEAMRDLDIQHQRFRSSAAAALNLSLIEFGAFTFIGNRGETTPKAIATDLQLTTGAVTALLDRLTTASLIERHANPADRRSILVHLSEHGEQLRDTVYDRYLAAITAYFAGTPAATASAFLICINRATAAVEDQINLFDQTRRLS